MTYQDRRQGQKQAAASCPFWVEFWRLTGPAICPGPVAGRGHSAGARNLRSASIHQGAGHRFGWRQSPGVPLPGSGRRVPAWRIRRSAAGHRRAARVNVSTAARRIRSCLGWRSALLPAVPTRQSPGAGGRQRTASPPNQSSSCSNSAGKIWTTRARPSVGKASLTSHSRPASLPLRQKPLATSKRPTAPGS